MQNNQENQYSNKSLVKKDIPIEDYIDFSIIKKEEIYSEKLSLDIRLYKEYKKSELRKFAYYIKNDFAKKAYKRIFITYYLPGMKVGNGAWATSHFNPNLEVVMTSPYFDDTKEIVNPNGEKIQLVLEKYTENLKNKKIIGFWKENENFITAIYKRNKKYYLNEISLKSGSKGKDYELIVKSKNNKQTFIIKELLYPKNPNDTKLIGEYTDYYLIEANGDLALYDDIGIIEKYHKITTYNTVYNK